MTSASLAQLDARFAELAGANLQLDLTRGKPAADQLTLADRLDGILGGDYRAADGTDTRNYGGLRGLPEARALGAALLDTDADDVIAFDNSSLMLMYLYLDTAMRDGVRGVDSAWQREADRTGRPVEFLCPSPGYDRHFAICEQLGIRMRTVAIGADGPDMDEVEALVRAEPMIKGIWCVPKHSNPTGSTYSAATVERIAALPAIAGANFRVMWDNAYAVHDFAESVALRPVMPLARTRGTDDGIVMTTSTSKISFAGGGISFLASSPANLAAFEKRLGVMTIGPDKVNQLRHVKLLPDLAAVRAHMRQQGELLLPKFRIVQERLQQGLGELGIARWTQPSGGYFVSLDTRPGRAREVVRLAAELGVKLTPAGATFPYGLDAQDTNIRIAPSFPEQLDVERAIDVLILCVKLADARTRHTPP